MTGEYIPAMRAFPDESWLQLRHMVQAGAKAAVVPAAAPPGVVWSRDACLRRRDEVVAAGLIPLVIESIATTDDMKTGGANEERDTDSFLQTMSVVAESGYRVVTYNWQIVCDWLRTDLQYVLPDGSTTLAYRHEDLSKLAFSGKLSLPGWGAAVSGSELRRRVVQHEGVSEGQLWDALARFVERVVPVAEDLGLLLALHPDDPPWSVFGLPRIVVNDAALQRVLSLSDSRAHGIAFCSGALGANPSADLPDIVRRCAGRIHFVHLRDVTITGPRAFFEAAHGNGDLRLPEIMKSLVQTGYSGPLRPDHGRNVFNENPARAGYGLYDRALGLRYLQGLSDGIAAATGPGG